MCFREAILALITCYECKQQVSDLAKTCPHCGAPVIQELRQNEKTEIGIENSIKRGAAAKESIINKFKHEREIQQLVGMALLAFVIIIIFLVVLSKSQNDTTLSSKNEATVSVLPDIPKPEISSKEHLENAKKALLANDLEQGIKHLSEIKEGDENYEKAQELLKDAKHEKNSPSMALAEVKDSKKISSSRREYICGSCMIGDVCVIINDGFNAAVATNKSNWKAWTQCAVDNDMMGALNLIAAGRVIALEDGTKVNYLDAESIFSGVAKIRVLTGEYKGLLGYIMASSLCK
jgi:uncharacterized Zn finger protein (UPF0148 family)